jgi:hypothetical protein
MLCSLYSSILPIGANVGGEKALPHNLPALGNKIWTLRNPWETANSVDFGMGILILFVHEAMTHWPFLVAGRVVRFLYNAGDFTDPV